MVTFPSSVAASSNSTGTVTWHTNLSFHSSLQEWSSPSPVWLMGRTWTAEDINSAWVSSWRRKDPKDRRGERKATQNNRKSPNVKMPQKSTQWHINTPSLWVLHTCTHSLALNLKPQHSQGTPVLYWRNQALVFDHLKKKKNPLYFHVWQPNAENLLSDWHNGRTCQAGKTSVLQIVSYFWPDKVHFVWSIGVPETASLFKLSSAVQIYSGF